MRLLFVVLAFSACSGSLQTEPPVAEETREDLAALEEKIVAAAEKAKPSVVRIAWVHDISQLEDYCCGVILTADGYVATFAYEPFSGSYDLAPGKDVAVYLADGRRVSGVALGSRRQWGFGLVKITQKGVWPHAEPGTSTEVELGEVCLSLGYPPATHVHMLDIAQDPSVPEPSVRVGHVISKELPGQLGTSCRIASGDRGGGLFDLQGRLIGLNLALTSSHEGTMHSTIDVVQQHWEGLARRKPPAEGPDGGQAETTRKPSSKKDLSLARRLARNIAIATDKARRATVLISPVGEEKQSRPNGVSGTLVTSDGYVATCAHHHLPRGTDVTIHLADDRAVPGKILGRVPLLDIGLAKITAPGPWPHVAWGSTADAKAGDACVLLGYPGHLQRKGKSAPVIRVGWVLDARAVPGRLASSCLSWGGDSGGGLFDGEGRLIGVHNGLLPWGRMSASSGADLFKERWDYLVDGPPLAEPVPFAATSTAETLRKAIEHVQPITVEVLGDEKRRALGTIVSSDGSVLTKASELYGNISCRLADGRVLPAAVVKVSRQHDLALLKIDATELPQIPWSGREQIPVGTLVGALRYAEPPVVGVAALATRAVARTTGLVGIGKVKDAEGGIEVVELKSRWKSASSKSPIRERDVIVHIEGRPTPNVKTFEKIAAPDHRGRELPFVFAGDPVRVGVKRSGKDLELRFPSISYMHNPGDKTSRRKTGFAAVFDTDAIITADTCGGPVVDRSGEVVGITIALPTEARVYVVPAAVARKVAEHLKQ
jgi:serine protease Do